MVKSSMFKILKNAYAEGKNGNSIADIYEKYSIDHHKTIDIEDRRYYRIIQLYQIRTKRTITIVVLDSKFELRIGDELIDENNRYYTVKGFEMLRLNAKE